MSNAKGSLVRRWDSRNVADEQSSKATPGRRRLSGLYPWGVEFCAADTTKARAWIGIRTSHLHLHIRTQTMIWSARVIDMLWQSRLLTVDTDRDVDEDFFLQGQKHTDAKSHRIKLSCIKV